MTWEPTSKAASMLGLTSDALDKRARRRPDKYPHRKRRGKIEYWMGDGPPPPEGAPDAVVVGDPTESRADLDTLRARLSEAHEYESQEGGRAESIDELIDRRVDAFRRKAAKAEPKIYRIDRARPFAVCHLGDPHIDDDGCDWPELLRTIKCIKRTPGMYGGNVGDSINNWVGRLQALYRHQTTTEDEAFKLARWLLTSIEWDYVVLGNHDKWQQGTIIFELLAEQSRITAIENNEVRIEYRHPDGGVYRLCVRHDFKGGSQWNKSHALMKRHKLRPWADLNVAGHRHVWAVNQEESHDGRCETSLRVRGFKRYDDYANALDFRVDELGAAITTVHDPSATHPGERVRIFFDVEEASLYLGWLRSRR